MTDTNSTRSLLQCEPFTRHTAFTLWRLEPNPNDPSKPPVKVPVHWDGVTHHSTGNPRKGIPPNPAPPLTAQQAIDWLAHHHANGNGHARPREVGYLGAGFRPAGTGLVCIDADDCITPEGWTPGALALIARFPGALIEQSIGGTGSHVWVSVTGDGPGKKVKQKTPIGALEVYSEGQFIACGTVLGGDARVDHTAAVQALVAEFWPNAGHLREDRALPNDWEEKTPEQRATTVAELRDALTKLDSDDNHEWTSVGIALSSLGETGYELWAEWSATSSRFPGGDGLHEWDRFYAERTDYRAVFSKAERNGWVNPARRPALGDAASVFASAPVQVVEGLAGLPPGAVLERPASVPDPANTPNADLSFMGASSGLIAATVASVETALLSTESGVKIAYDTFKDRLSISVGGADWRPFKDTDYGRLRAGFERRGFKPVPAEAMSTAVAMVAEANAFDSAQQWVSGLVWDGIKRLETAFVRYYGCADTPYTRALGPYAFTTLAGRALVPGEKADMAIIMVGLQGVRKTSALEALVPEPDAFGEVDLSKDDDAIARKLRGKMVVELAEMRGFHGRDADANKAWVSRRREEWTPKYKEFTTTYWRRCLLIGTANDMEQLDDPTGARRFLPVRVGMVDLEALRADRDQLWAEGAAQFKASGVAWQDAERLAKDEHHKFEVVDELQHRLLAWLDAAPEPTLGKPLDNLPRHAKPLHGHEILTGALGMTYGQIKKGDEMRLAKNMKRLGYERFDAWVGEKNIKMWRKAGGEGGGEG